VFGLTFSVGRGKMVDLDCSLNGCFVNESDFLYNYAKVYHAPNVRTVLARENWADRDCDVKYARYMQDYIKVKGQCATLSDDKIGRALELLRNNRVKNTYKFIFDEMIGEMRKQKPVDDSQYDSFKMKLSPLETVDDFNFEYLDMVRKIEEEFYS